MTDSKGRPIVRTTFGLDYDHTYTNDPEFWDTFIKNCEIGGHKVYIVTFRDKLYDWTPLLTRLAYDLNVDVIMTGGVAKDFYCQNFGPDGGVKIDVWIDDRPSTIHANSTLNPEGLRAWREAQALAASNEPAYL